MQTTYNIYNAMIFFPACNCHVEFHCLLLLSVQPESFCHLRSSCLPFGFVHYIIA